MAQIIELGGRKFHSVEQSTIEHDLTVMRMLAEVGLDKAAQREGESYDDFAVRLLSQVIASNKAFDLIGGFIMEADCPDADWTPESGKAVAKFVSKLTSQDDKLQIRQLVVSLLVGFSQAGLLSFAASPTSSTEEEETAVARPATTLSTPGAISSVNSVGSIQPGMWRSAGALWRKAFGVIRSSSAAKRARTTG